MKNDQTSISIDMKWYRMRVSKTAMELLNDPPFVQLLIHPTQNLIALRPCENKDSSEFTLRVNYQKNHSYFVMQSKYLVTKLANHFPWLHSDYSFRMQGELDETTGIVVFHIDQATRVNIALPKETENGSENK